MAGKVLFEQGPHASRTGYRGEITEADWRVLRSAAPSCVSDEALAGLTDKIMFAEANAKRGDAYVATRHQLAQLKKLKRLARRNQDVVVDVEGREHRFAELADALANLDQGTLELIQAAERGAIQAILDKDGVFVDVDGDEHHFYSPAIEVVRPFISKHVVHSDHPACRGVRMLSRTPASVWLPRGIEGFKEAIAAAINELDAQRDDVGRREKPWQDELAKAVVEFWQTYCPNEPQAANRSSRTGRYSPVVGFAEAVFAAAAVRPILSASRLANLLHLQRAK